MRVLIVEDEPPIMRVLKNFIEGYSQSFKVIEMAINGIKALEILEQKKVDLIFTDIRMPVMGGLELIEKVREKNVDIPIVIVSGYQEFEYVRTALRHGVSDYLLKPIISEEVDKVLSKVEKELRVGTEDEEAELEVEVAIERYIHKHYRECINTNSIAKEFGFVPSYISKLFKNYKGMSPSEYLAHYRVEKAKGLMEQNPKILIKEVAVKVGFNDQHHFSKIFKKHTEVWPTEYMDHITRV